MKSGERRGRVSKTHFVPSIMYCLSDLGWLHMRVQHRLISQVRIEYIFVAVGI